MVLPAGIRELRLQEELAARDAACRDSRSDGSLDVVLALIGGIDRPKTLGERQCGQLLGPLLLPSSAIEKSRNGDLLDRDEVAHADEYSLAPREANFTGR